MTVCKKSEKRTWSIGSSGYWALRSEEEIKIGREFKEKVSAMF